jgi:hypothetical protein
MPTVLRTGAFRVTIYPNDHGPSHVHVLGPGTQAIFYLGCPDGPPTLRASYGLTTRELNHLEAGLAANLAALCNEWERIHGRD